MVEHAQGGPAATLLGGTRHARFTLTAPPHCRASYDWTMHPVTATSLTPEAGTAAVPCSTAGK